MIQRTGWIFLGLFAIYLVGFGIDIMDIDAAQYASMSREMMETNSYLQLYDLGKDYLDKPPFLFWISALSMKIFGANNFGYRLPSFLFALFAIFSTYKLARHFYDRVVAQWSSVILASCQGFFLICHDIRTDTVLMSWVVFSLWQLTAWFQNGGWKNFVLGFAGIAFGMMSKGPIALLVPAFAFGSHFLLHRKFNQVFRWQYIVGIIIIAILLLPMCIGLYRQFDLHPEKLVNGSRNVSGLRFFFWTQSFGRITGESSWDNGANIFFLLQNMAWSFFPWIILFILALFSELKIIAQQRFRLLRQQEAITTGGFVLSYFALGLSNYQLPHYIFVAFPLAAIITAKYLHKLIDERRLSRTYQVLTKVHFLLFILVWIAIIVLMHNCFDDIPVAVPIVALLMFGFYLFAFFSGRTSVTILPFICLYTIMSANIFLNGWFYPSLLKYQAGNVAGKWIRERQIPAAKIFVHQYEEFRSMHFYSRMIIPHKDSVRQFRQGDYIITSKENLPGIRNAGYGYQQLFEQHGFRVSRLSLKFLRKSTRPQTLEDYVIIQIK